MKLYHTSPLEISKIKTSGRFGEFLCFSGHEYVMTAGGHVLYKIEIDEGEIIDDGSLFYHPDAGLLDDLVSDFCARFDVDADTAEEIISGRAELDRDVHDADDSWDAQEFTARAAKILGYRGVRARDEQGTLYMIDMLGRESELVRAS